MRELILIFADGSAQRCPLSNYKPESRRAREADDRALADAIQQYGAPASACIYEDGTKTIDYNLGAPHVN